jgi:hypothetical protein
MSQAAYFPERWPLIIDFFGFFITVYGDSGSKSGFGIAGTGTVKHFGSGSSSAKAKSYGSCGSSFGSGSTTLLMRVSVSSFRIIK